jgi:hypothetical protein
LTAKAPRSAKGRQERDWVLTDRVEPRRFRSLIDASRSAAGCSRAAARVSRGHGKCPLRAARRDNKKIRAWRPLRLGG